MPSSLKTAFMLWTVNLASSSTVYLACLVCSSVCAFVTDLVNAVNFDRINRVAHSMTQANSFSRWFPSIIIAKKFREKWKVRKNSFAWWWTYTMNRVRPSATTLKWWIALRSSTRCVHLDQIRWSDRRSKAKVHLHLQLELSNYLSVCLWQIRVTQLLTFGTVRRLGQFIATKCHFLFASSREGRAVSANKTCDVFSWHEYPSTLCVCLVWSRLAWFWMIQQQEAHNSSSKKTAQHNVSHNIIMITSTSCVCYKDIGLAGS